MNPQQLGSRLDTLVPLGIGFACLMRGIWLSKRNAAIAGGAKPGRTLQASGALLIVAGGAHAFAAQMSGINNNAYEVVQQLNAGYPREIIHGTRFDSAELGTVGDERVICNFTEVNERLEDVDRAAWRKLVLPKIEAAALANSNTRKILDEGIILELRYHSSDKGIIGTVAMNKDDMKKPTISPNQSTDPAP
jgi:hypothetical protein